MYRLAFVMVASLIGWSGVANAQYINEKPQGPLLGGPGDYVYPALCRKCSVWQDYRNFAWNQLSINGGYARTPSNPNHVTTFRIFTNASNDLYPATVEITLKTENVEFMSTTVGYSITVPEHFLIETHPENGDQVPVSFLPKKMGKLVFPYDPRNNRVNRPRGSSRGTRPGRRGGGGRGSSGGGGRGAGFGSGGFGSADIFGWFGGTGGGGYCGIGTDYICIQF